MSHSQLSDQKDRATLLRRAPAADAPDVDSAAAHPLLALQRQVGNAQIARMLAQREDAPEEEEEVLQARHDPSVVQREDAPDEEEEDVLQARHDSSIAQREDVPDEEEEDVLQARHDSSIAQREDVPDEKEDEDKLMQAKPEVGLAGGPVSDAVAGQINSKRGSGSPLEDGTRATMEQSFGADFADVRVHTDSDAQHLNRSISAQAFTTGNDIFLGQGASTGDHGLLAHELTHVVQQRDMNTSGPMTVGPAGDSYEQQADSMSSAVTSGAATTAQRKLAEEQ